MAHSTKVEGDQRGNHPFKSIEAKIAQVETKQEEIYQPSMVAKIQKVPKHLRERDLELHLSAAASTSHHNEGAVFRQHNNKVAIKYYTPKMISIGPIHHDLKLGEQYKLRWTAKYVKETKRSTKELYEEIRNDISKLKNLFAKEVIEGYGDDDLAWMLFMDGCSVLHFMKHCNVQKPEKLEIKYDQLIYMSRDLLLLENQLPYQVLVLLSKNAREKSLESIMADYVRTTVTGERQYFTQNKSKPMADNVRRTVSGEPQHFTENKRADHRQQESRFVIDNEESEEMPIHLLHFVRTKALPEIGQYKNKQPKEVANDVRPTYKNIRDLKAAKIGVKKAKEGEGISYTTNFGIFGSLRIPRFMVDDTTAILVLNMIALEMCPDFHNDYEISSFVAFLESVIDDAEDVKELRKAGIIDNLLGSDEEVAQLFNAFSSDLVVEDRKYLHVKKEIELHYKHTVRTWIAEFISDHFHTPWTVGAFLAAIIALLLSGIQAFFSAFPRN